MITKCTTTFSRRMAKRMEQDPKWRSSPGVLKAIMLPTYMFASACNFLSSAVQERKDKQMWGKSLAKCLGGCYEEANIAEKAVLRGKRATAVLDLSPLFPDAVVVVVTFYSHPVHGIVSTWIQQVTCETNGRVYNDMAGTGGGGVFPEKW